MSKFDFTIDPKHLEEWQRIDPDFEENFAPLQDAISNYKKNGWDFMDKYLVDLFMYITITSSATKVQKASKFIKYGSIDFSKITPYTVRESNLNKKTVRHNLSPLDESMHPVFSDTPGRISSGENPLGNPMYQEDPLVLYHGKRDAVINILRSPTLERNIAATIRDLIIQENESRIFGNIFGNPPPPPDGFDAYKVLFEDCEYLDFIKYLGLNSLLRKIVYPRP